MREIKFRAWDARHSHWLKIRSLQFDGDLRGSEATGFEKDLAYFPIKENVILMQFTGLKDKNGKEIYEGDILGDVAWRQVVEWDKDSACFLGLESLWDFSVIGNIYETPDLLK